MTTLATDDFNRANAADLGANWSATGQAGWTQLKISSNTAVNPGISGSVRTAETFPDDQWAQATISDIAANVLWGGVIVRSSTVNATFYAAGLDPGDASNNRRRIWKTSAGARTSLAADASTDVAANDVLYLEMQGTSLVMKVNGSTTNCPSTTDASISSGKPGLTGRTSSADLPDFDDWSGGDFGSGATPTGYLNLPLLGVG